MGLWKAKASRSAKAAEQTANSNTAVRFCGAALDFIRHYERRKATAKTLAQAPPQQPSGLLISRSVHIILVVISHLTKQTLAAIACMGLCVFSLWLAFLSYRYVRFSSRYLGTPPHTLHSGREDCLVIFDGDSLTAGDGLSNETETYPFQAMAASGHSCTWENIAVSGALAGDRLGSPARLDSHGLRLYIIWVGSNDLMYRQEPVAEIWREMEEGLQARSRQGWRIAVGTITPRIQALRPDREIALFFGLFGPRSFESRRAVLNELIRRGASRGDFQLIDFAASPGVNRPDSVSSHYYLPDRAHFSASGSGVLARTAAPVVSAMLSSLLSQ